MRLTTAKKLRESDSRKIWLTCRRITALLGIFVFMSQTTQANPVQISDVLQRVNTLQSSLDLSLRNLSQDPISPDVKVSGTTGNGGSKGGAKTDSPLSGVIVDSTQPIGVEVVADAIVEGTVCDCGEILLPGGAFPKWPLLFLAGIPLIFIPHDDTPPTNPICTNCVITPLSSPTPPPNSTVPEPASLFLFGAGLLAFGAGLRRRYPKAKFEKETETKDE